MGTYLNVFLLRVEPDRRLFYSEAVETAPAGKASESPRRRGLRGWAETRFHRLKGALRHPQGRTTKAIRGVWHWLQERTHPDEILLSRLRSSERIVLRHPTAIDAAEVADDWSAFLTKGRRRHWPWFVVNLLVSPLSVLLAPLPGPNMLGYWFIYRAFHHLFILVGLDRVKKGWVETRLVADDRLDRPLGNGIEDEWADDHDSAVSRLASLGCDPSELREFLKRYGVKPSPALKGDHRDES